MKHLRPGSWIKDPDGNYYQLINYVTGEIVLVENSSGEQHIRWLPSSVFVPTLNRKSDPYCWSISWQHLNPHKVINWYDANPAMFDARMVLTK